MSSPCEPCAEIVIDPVRFDAIVTFTTTVAEVAGTLHNLGLADESVRLLDALDRLDASGDDGD